MNSKKLAILLPGIGYHRDKPLLYYASKLLHNKGYEIFHVEYKDLPAKIVGDPDMMQKAVFMAYCQSVGQLDQISFSKYADIVFIGKSIGTIIAAKYAAEYKINGRQIWYTPLEETFMFSTEDAVGFIGDADPWSDVRKVKELANNMNIKLYSYPDCNHSLECKSVDRNISIIREVMHITDAYLN
ncbi:MAG: alpha/beta hydrolase [Oscillospiraceae bacterium]|nr:alpha/beta hydrolase [Oscillospiraceae bacterium]